MDRQLQKLRRDELLEILLEVEQENELLTRRNLELREQLGNRELSIREAGSLAEASAKLTGLLQAAQDTADIYLQNVRDRCLEYARETEELCAQALERSGASGESVEDGVSLQDEVLRMFAQTMGEASDK